MFHAILAFDQFFMQFKSNPDPFPGFYELLQKYTALN